MNTISQLWALGLFIAGVGLIGVMIENKRK